MKTIKIIIGIISLISIIFFATGLVVKETNYASEITVNTSVETVFKAFTKQGNSKNWIPELKSIEILEEKLGKTGSTYTMIIDNQEQEIIVTKKIMAFVPNEKATYFFDAENLLRTNDYIFSEEKGITTIQLKASCKSKSYIMGCMLPFFKGVLTRQDESHLNNFKNFIEKQ